MKDRECKKCNKCGAELHPEFLVPVCIGNKYFCPKCAKEIKQLLGSEE